MTVILILAGLVMLYYGAEFLVKGSSHLAFRLGVTPLLIGLTIVACGTSMPELIVSLDAAATGKGDIAAGNVIGSNICNVGLILGLAALLAPLKVKSQLIKFDSPVMIFSTLLCCVFLANGNIGRYEAGAMFVLFIAYNLVNIKIARLQNLSGKDVASEEEFDFKNTKSLIQRSMGLQIAFIIGGLLILVGGSECLIKGSVELARWMGVSEAVIGLTIVALGTSLPELATSVVAAIKKEADIAIGNIVGSCTFNILGILGLSGMIVPIKAPGIEKLDLYTMMILAILLLPFMWTRKTISRTEGFVFLSIYALYIVILAIR
ncbi:MAG: calcium/sodium antiporter [Candidatus Izemoplasmatales bacterium]|nr:calcium/sodium antiporter [Candidatus Izemoplasmatales bacterium]